MHSADGSGALGFRLGCVLTTPLCLNPTRTPKADMKKGPFGPCVWVISAADVCVAEHDVALRADLIPPHTTEAFAQLGAQQACVRQVFDRHSDTVEVPPKAPWLHGTAYIRELGQELLRNIVLGLEGVRQGMQAQPRL